MAILDDLVPVPLQRWDTDTLARLRADGKCEGLHFEFKSDWKPDDVTRCVCAFANGAGGYLIFGIGTGSDGCIDSMPGLDPGPEYPLLAKDRIVGHISPLPLWDAVAVPSPDDPARPVLVLRIEESPRPPHLIMTSGKHYIRTPSACDPITDRATLDGLFAKAQVGRAAMNRRADQLRALPIDRAPESDEWITTVIAVPDPSLDEDTYRTLVGPEWRERGRELFASPGMAVQPRHLLEDGVLFDAGGGQELIASTDGAVRARWILGPRDLLRSYERSVPASWIGSVIDDVLRAQTRLRPVVRQSRLTVVLSRVVGMTVIAGNPQQVNVPSRGQLPPEWSREVLTLTEEPHAELTREAILRRLWRAAGADVPEPDQ